MVMLLNPFFVRYRAFIIQEGNEKSTSHFMMDILIFDEPCILCSHVINYSKQMAIPETDKGCHKKEFVPHDHRFEIGTVI